MSGNDDSRRAYRIGYGKPPEATRFRKGRSGNPAGKIPGTKSLKAELLDELSQKVPVTENGKRRLMSRQRLIVKRVLADAAKGDAKAREQLFRLIEQIERAPPVNPDAAIARQEDQQILEGFRRRLLAEVRESDSADEEGRTGRPTTKDRN